MSRRNSRRRQQAMNEWRRTGRVYWLASLGIPVQIAPAAWFIPSDPVREREEFVRQIMAPVPDVEGPHRPVIRGEIGSWEGFRFITSDTY